MQGSISILDLSDKTNIIDIRSIEKYNNNHIDGAINIPYEKLIINPGQYLIKNETYYIYCQKGIQSRKVCQILRNYGYKVVNINGGYEAWMLEKN